MIDRLRNWFRARFGVGGPADSPARRATGAGSSRRRTQPRPKAPDRGPEFVEADDQLAGRVESNGPGKNVLIRNRYVREDTGTHETLKILDDSVVDSGEEPGEDPYNTGGFDRSRNWERRFRK